MGKWMYKTDQICKLWCKEKWQVKKKPPNILYEAKDHFLLLQVGYHVFQQEFHD